MGLIQINNEQKLLQNIAEGDEKAFALFFNHYYPQLRPFIAKFFKDEGQIEDAIEETFIRIWLNRDQLPEIKNVQAWLHTIVSRICLNLIRNSIMRNQKEDEYSNNSIKHVLPTNDYTPISEINKLIAKTVNQMPEARRNIFLLSREDGLKPAEIALKLSLSVQTVKNVLVTPLKEIRAYLVKNGHIINLLFIMLNFF